MKIQQSFVFMQLQSQTATTELYPVAYISVKIVWHKVMIKSQF